MYMKRKGKISRKHFLKSKAELFSTVPSSLFQVLQVVLTSCRVIICFLAWHKTKWTDQIPQIRGKLFFGYNSSERASTLLHEILAIRLFQYLIFRFAYFATLKGATSSYTYFEKKKNWFIFQIVISNPCILLHPQPSLFLFVLESYLWCFASLANHYFWASKTLTVI